MLDGHGPAAAGVDLVHVPYRGRGQSRQDLLAGRPLVAFDTVAAASSFVRAGRLRALGVSSAKRLADFPDVPAVEEAGVPGYQLATWYGAFAPAGTPSAIVGRLHAEFMQAMQSPDLKSQLAGLDADDTVTRTPAEFAAIVRTDTTRYAKLVKDAGLKIE